MLCAECRYWDSIKGKEIGRCRKKPPVVLAIHRPIVVGSIGIADTKIETHYPRTSALDMCGEGA